MSAQKVNSVIVELFIYVALLFILLLTATNIESYQAPKIPLKVLGAKTQVNSDDKFWGDFLTKNPSYIPGWVETGKMDKAKEIDPNYLIQTSP